MRPSGASIATGQKVTASLMGGASCARLLPAHPLKMKTNTSHRGTSGVLAGNGRPERGAEKIGHITSLLRWYGIVTRRRVWRVRADDRGQSHALAASESTMRYASRSSQT